MGWSGATPVLSWKDSVRVATAAALPAVTYDNGTAGVGATLTADAVGVLTVDGVATVLGDKVLVKNQVAGLQNGPYDVTVEGTAGVAAVLTRSPLSDEAAEVPSEAMFVQEGTANADSGFTQTVDAPITMGTTALVYVQFTGLGQITAGTGMTKTGNTLNVIGGTGITANADDIEIDSTVVTVGGAFHDGFSDFVANEHIDWTSASDNFSTSGTLASGNATVTGGVLVDQDADAIAIEIDSESTAANALEVNADALTTGSIAQFLSNSSSAAARSLVVIINEHASASSTGVCRMRQDAGGQNLNLTSNGNGISLYIDSAATAGATIDIDNPATTTGDIIRINDADALTTGSILGLKSNSADTGTRSLVSIHNDHVDATGTTVLKLTQDSTGLALDADGAATFNEAGADVDYRFEGDTLAYMLFMEGNAASENIALLAAALPNWQAMDRGVFIGDVTTAPTGNPTAGIFVWSLSGVGQARAGSGTVTDWAPAGPHCAKCGYDAWAVACHNDIWKSWHYECGNCGEVYKGGPKSILDILGKKERSELIRKGMGWDEVSKKFFGAVA